MTMMEESDRKMFPHSSGKKVANVDSENHLKAWRATIMR